LDFGFWIFQKFPIPKFKLLNRNSQDSRKNERSDLSGRFCGSDVLSKRDATAEKNVPLGSDMADTKQNG
jgi:hypothetical protein